MRTAAASPLDSLDLVGDGDAADLIRAIEQSFALEFADEAHWTTVGDIYDTVMARLPTTDQGGKCASSMAFYRLRAAIGRITGDARAITPATRLRDLSLPAPRTFHRRIRAELGCNRLPLTLSWRGGFGLLAMVLGVVALFVAKGIDNAWPMLLLPLGLAMCLSDRGSYGTQTVGELAQEIAANNFVLLAEAGADQRPQAVWRALCEIIANSSDLDVEPARIAASTRLMA